MDEISIDMDNRKKIGLLTSGGDAPGMNAAIRAVVRAAVNSNVSVIGIRHGYDGLLKADIVELGAKNVSEIMQLGGTILKTARSADMMASEGQEKAANICKILALDALFVIGGDGSLTGGLALSRLGVNIIGIPGTIDLDLDCSDYTIGFDTAVNTGTEAMNKIRDTSSSHERVSVVQVMGRNCGYIALWCGATAGAEEMLLPENGALDIDAVIRTIIQNRSKGKNHNLIVVAEGVGSAIDIAKAIEDATGIESRATILGYLQRGGAPSAVDRMHASAMGYEAVMAYLRGERNRVVVYKRGEYMTVDLEEGLAVKRPFNHRLYQMIKMLSV